MSGGVESKKAENKPRAMSSVWPVLEKQGKKSRKTPGKDQSHRQEENRGCVSGLVVKTKMWPGRNCKGGEDHREPKLLPLPTLSRGMLGHRLVGGSGWKGAWEPGRPLLDACKANCSMWRHALGRPGPLSQSRWHHAGVHLTWPAYKRNVSMLTVYSEASDSLRASCGTHSPRGQRCHSQRVGVQ